jgi:hypothetical protein
VDLRTISENVDPVVHRDSRGRPRRSSSAHGAVVEGSRHTVQARSLVVLVALRAGIAMSSGGVTNIVTA